MVPLFAMVHCATMPPSSFGSTYGTRHRKYNFIFEVAVSHLTTSSVVWGNGFSFTIYFILLFIFIIEKIIFKIGNIKKKKKTKAS